MHAESAVRLRDTTRMTETVHPPRTGSSHRDLRNHAPVPRFPAHFPRIRKESLGKIHADRAANHLFEIPANLGYDSRDAGTKIKMAAWENSDAESSLGIVAPGVG